MVNFVTARFLVLTQVIIGQPDISSGFCSAGQSEGGWHSTDMVCHLGLHKWRFEGLDSSSFLKEYLQWLAPAVYQLWGASGRRGGSLGLSWLPLLL